MKKSKSTIKATCSGAPLSLEPEKDSIQEFETAMGAAGGILTKVRTLARHQPFEE